MQPKSKKIYDPWELEWTLRWDISNCLKSFFYGNTYIRKMVFISFLNYSRIHVHFFLALLRFVFQTRSSISSSIHKMVFFIKTVINAVTSTWFHEFYHSYLIWSDSFSSSSQNINSNMLKVLQKYEKTSTAWGKEKKFQQKRGQRKKAGERKSSR